MWCFDNRRAGFSLTEVLVVLAILSLTVAVFATARPGPSPAMRQQAISTDLIVAASQVRAEAIVQGRSKLFSVQAALCPDSVQTLTFFPNGTATEAKICLTGAQHDSWLYLDPLTGLLARIDAP